MAKKKDKKKNKENEANSPKVKRKVYEIFKIKDKGKEKTIKTCGVEELVPATKKQIKEHNRILRNIFMWFGIFALIFILTVLFINYIKHFDYNSIEFDIIKEGNVIFYHTSFPVVYEGQHLNYNVYLRNDPRNLEEVPFDGDLHLLEMMVIDNTDSFVCGGDGGIAMYNFQQVIGVFGTSLMKDPEADCDSLGRYMFVKIQPGNITNIEQTGPSCYTLNVNDCEILKVTERFLVEVLVEKLTN